MVPVTPLAAGMKVASHIADGGFDSQAWLSEMLAFMNLRFDGK